MNHSPRYSVNEFERESRYIENLIWDALVIESGTRVLFCGYTEDGKWVKRAIDAGAAVSVVEHSEPVIRRHEDLGATLLQGSTSLIPAKTESFDLAVAFHYLHEADPFFHAQILSELARVARRVAVVEPGPPADALGKKIARLYSQAKRELGDFEYYQPLAYWRKLLQAVKADVSQHVFAFAKVPPHEYLHDTIELLLDTMEAEDAPRSDLDELRAIARRSETMILPPARFVLTGAALGSLPQPVFTPREEPTPTPAVAQEAARSLQSVPEQPNTMTVSGGYEFPPVEAQPPPSMQPLPTPPPPSAPGLPGFPSMAPPPIPPAEPVVPFGAPFAVPPIPSWQWEPPEGREPKG